MSKDYKKVKDFISAIVKLNKDPFSLEEKYKIVGNIIEEYVNDNWIEPTERPLVARLTRIRTTNERLERLSELERELGLSGSITTSNPIPTPPESSSHGWYSSDIQWVNPVIHPDNEYQVHTLREEGIQIPNSWIETENTRPSNPTDQSNR